MVVIWVTIYTCHVHVLYEVISGIYIYIMLRARGTGPMRRDVYMYRLLRALFTLPSKQLSLLSRTSFYSRLGVVSSRSEQTLNRA